MTVKFSELNLVEPLLKALELEKYAAPSPIQSEAIPHLLEGRDMFGCAQTGTGKTAAFALPILQRILLKKSGGKGRRPLRALVLAPTRELARQVADSFKSYARFTGLKTAVIYGGVSQHPQTASLRQGVDVLVATPGRLVDLMNQKLCSLREVEMLVLDEADHMLDLGFIHDVKTIVRQVPPSRQTLMFSATMPKEITALADGILRDPVKLSVTPASTPVEIIDQKVYFVDKSNKGRLLVDLLHDRTITSGLVFSRTKHGADKICKMLGVAGIRSNAIHGGKSQSARQEALSSFKKGKVRVLVATDIAARGIDVKDLSHVVNYDLPYVPETYVHRIGRTGRAGNTGMAISFCDSSERQFLQDIQRLIKTTVDVEHNHAYTVQRPARQVSQNQRPARQAGQGNFPARSSSGKPGRKNPRSTHSAPGKRWGRSGERHQTSKAS